MERLPSPSPETVAAHLAALAETGVSASTLKVRRAAGLADPSGSELVKRARDRRRWRVEVRRHGDPLHAEGDGEAGGRGKVPRGSAGSARLIRPRGFHNGVRRCGWRKTWHTGEP